MLWQPGAFGGGKMQPRDRWRRPQTPPASAAYVFRDTQNGADGFNFFSWSIDIGTASADRLVIVAACIMDATPALTSVVVNGVTLTNDVTFAASNISGGIASALVTSGSGAQTVTVTFAGSGFNNKHCCVWTATGLNSNSVKHTLTTTANSGTISVTAGDFLFSIAADNSGGAGPPNYSASTEAPFASHSSNDGSKTSVAPDWTIASTNASFSVNPQRTASSGFCAASYI